MRSVSIIVVTTGLPSRLSHLSNLLGSLSRQSIKDFELIIASESQSTRLTEIFGSFFCRCERHTVLITGTWNKCKTANRAIEDSCGEIIVLLEDDLILENRWLEKVLSAFSEVPHAGCIYPKCIWACREGLSSKHGAASFVGRMLGKLSIYESVLRKQTTRINDHLTEVPIFTMCVACKREALYRAGLFDESLEEPMQGEDFDLAFRIRAAGLPIFASKEPIGWHFTKQVTRKSAMFARDPASIESVFGSEAYFFAKNWRSIGFALLGHMVYRLIESIAWTIKSKRVTLPFHGAKGLFIGMVHGIHKHGTLSRPYRPPA